jgi:hypothetical protein
MTARIVALPVDGGYCRRSAPHGGSDFDRGQFEEVGRFVADVSARSLQHYDIEPDSGGALAP